MDPAGLAFDAAADDYDEREAANPIMRRMRERSLAVLRTTFPPGSRLLDVGAGTGIEAWALVAEGRVVVATDVSGAMLRRLREKAKGRGLGIETHELPARRVGDLAGRYGASGFDGAYSSFGPLNTEADLAPVRDGLAHLVRPGGAFVAGVLNRFAVVEMLLYLAALRPRAAARRLGRSEPFRVGDRGPTIPIRYLSLRELRRGFAPAFRLERCEALPLAVPPPYAWDRARRFPRLLRALERVDGALAGRRGFRGLGDHHLVTLRRTRDGEPTQGEVPGPDLPSGGRPAPPATTDSPGASADRSPDP